MSIPDEEELIIINNYWSNDSELIVKEIVDEIVEQISDEINTNKSCKCCICIPKGNFWIFDKNRKDICSSCGSTLYNSIKKYHLCTKR
jgi:hypothetical protein